jgi:hypothetical protein
MANRTPQEPVSDAPEGGAGSAKSGKFSHLRTRNVSLRTAPPDDSKFAKRLAEMEQQLTDKEEVIVTLTARLEQAAEQLDRFRRCGNAVPGRTGPGSGGSLSEDHKAALDDLKGVVTRWEEMQCEATLGRLETQVSELRDMVASFVGGGGAPVTFTPRPAAHVAADSGEAKPAGSWWEATKAAMMNGEEPPPAPSYTTRETVDEGSSETASDGTYEPAFIPHAPESIDYDTVTLEQAAVALRERDQLILRLREMLLAQQAAREFAHVSSLEDLPDALRTRLETVEKEWQGKFRQMELDLSRERARLARTEATIRQQQELIQKEMTRLGIDEAAAAANAASPARHGHEKGEDGARRRWFKFLGKEQG